MVGVPPEEILLEVMLAVEKQHGVAKRFLQVFSSLDAQAKSTVSSTCEEIQSHLLPLRQHIACIWQQHTRLKPSMDMSTEEIESLLIEEVQRLDVRAGVEAMIQVTSRFTAGKVKDRENA